jgi:ribose 5-phosphate isomerase B
MTQFVVAIASDHAGFELKEWLKEALQPFARDIRDLGTYDAQSVDYPDYGHAIAKEITQNGADFGVAICGSGLGIGMAANRHAGIRAATLARRHNNANVLCLGARLIGTETARDCVRQFFTTEFEGGRHTDRIQKIEISH